LVDRVWHAVGCAFFGALFGAVLAGVRMYFGHSFSWAPIIWGAVICGLLALVFGAVIGELLAAPWHFAQGVLVGFSDLSWGTTAADTDHLPGWLKAVFWLGVATGIAWFIFG